MTIYEVHSFLKFSPNAAYDPELLNNFEKYIKEISLVQLYLRKFICAHFIQGRKFEHKLFIYF